MILEDNLKNENYPQKHLKNGYEPKKEMILNMETTQNMKPALEFKTTSTTIKMTPKTLTHVT